MASDAPLAMRHAGVVRARSAAPAGFYDFYSVQFAPMVRLARGMVDTSECAEEIVQEVFLRVFQHWDRLYEPLGYLRTAVINAARSELRKREVRRRVGRRLPPARVPTQGEYLVDPGTVKSLVSPPHRIRSRRHWTRAPAGMKM